MSVIYLGTISGPSVLPARVAPMPKPTTPGLQEADSRLKAQGARDVADQAYQAALQNLSKLLGGVNVSISTYLERETGLQRVTINDGESGKRIVDMPPQAVVDIAERARQNTIGWLLDISA